MTFLCFLLLQIFVFEGGKSEGVYFVSGTTTDHGWEHGTDTKYFLFNTFEYLWPEIAQSGDILLVQDNGGWSDSWKQEMDFRIMSYTVRTCAGVQASDIDIDTYKLIIVSEGMESSSSENMESLIPSIESFVESGGVFVDMVASNNDRRWAGEAGGPFSVKTAVALEPDNFIEVPSHPMVKNMTGPFITGNYASHTNILDKHMCSLSLLTAGQTLGGVDVANYLTFQMHADCGSNCNLCLNSTETPASPEFACDGSGGAFFYVGNCTECNAPNYDTLSSCFTCRNYYSLASNCTECGGESYGLDCENCPSNYDKLCSSCVDHYSLSSGCTVCEDNYDIESHCTVLLCQDPKYSTASECTECLGNYDESTSCQECKNHWEGEMCLECPSDFDPNTDCNTCAGVFMLPFGDRCEMDVTAFVLTLLGSIGGGFFLLVVIVGLCFYCWKPCKTVIQGCGRSTNADDPPNLQNNQVYQDNDGHGSGRSDEEVMRSVTTNSIQEIELSGSIVDFQKTLTIKDSVQEFECIICMNSGISIKFKPCNHANCCETCSKKIFTTSKKCPVCRATIVKMKRAVVVLKEELDSSGKVDKNKARERIKAKRNYISENVDELDILEGEEIEIIEEKGGDMYFGKNLSTSKVGLFPRSCVDEETFYDVVNSYIGQGSNELSIEKGDVLILIKKEEKEWFFGRKTDTGETGLFPTSFVKLRTDPFDRD